MPPPGPPPKPPRRSTHPLEARPSWQQSPRPTQDSEQVFLAVVAAYSRLGPSFLAVVALYRRLGTRLFGSRTLRRAPQGSSPWTSFADFLSRALPLPSPLRDRSPGFGGARAVGTV